MSEFNPDQYLTKVSGSAYLEVKWRIYWMRTQHPEAIIRTDLVSNVDNVAVFKAEVSIPNGGSATGWGSESYGDFRDYLEKAETKALGRALACLGFGTQFAGDDLAEATGPRNDPARPGAMTDPQRKKIFACGMRDRHLEGTEIEAIATRRYGVEKINDLTRQQASDFIVWLESGDLDEGAATDYGPPPSRETGEIHPAVADATEARDATWIAAITGAASVGELAGIGNQISAAKAMTPPVKKVFDTQLESLRNR